MSKNLEIQFKLLLNSNLYVIIQQSFFNFALMSDLHTFHIPVMGTAFTADTPLKVSQYGINSVISIMDDVLLERLRKFYSDKNNIDYTEITKKTKDYREF